MEARTMRYLVILFLCQLFMAQAAEATNGRPGNMRTRNFVITAPDQQLASQIGFAAEKYRKELAKEWLGRELPDWPEPCVITAYLKPQAFGETSFSFAGQRGRPSRPFDFVMQVNGSRERILDSVLPHEISHTIFATHFGQPLPRWADEGACTVVEHISERRKNHRMLIEFLTTGRGIPFNKMFAMKNYPRDILPLYAQGYSLCRYLIQRGGKRKFIEFMGEGLRGSNWNVAVQKYYSVSDLSQLQVKWLKWVKSGCPRPEDVLVKADAMPTDSANSPATQAPNPTQVAMNQNSTSQDSAPPQQYPTGDSGSGRPDMQTRQNMSGGSSENFYLREIARVKAQSVRR